MRGRSLVLALGLACSLAATGWLAAQENTVPETAEAVPSRPPLRQAADDLVPEPRPQSAAEIRIEALDRHAGDRGVKELFAARSWQPAAPVIANNAPPPPPTAPGLPFVYLGKMLVGEQLTVFLAHQDRNLVVKEGETIDGTWRIDSIRGPVLTLTYLPLDTQQTMHIGEQP
ncbi:MAG TPA: hypothetical protein VF522_05430 [Ramlibacter sp.]|uniref:hypothetical protein n=1 Tax=Ramlibacter sp. TaxID=1917967 RepID=UPI002ED4DE7E